MFILTGSLKQKAVTAGVLIACFVLVAFSLRLVQVNGYYAIPFSVFFILIVGAIYKGMNVGYGVARFIFGTLAIAWVGGAINPFAYMDIEAAHGSFSCWILGIISAGIVAGLFFYCLGEHAGLRELQRGSAEKTEILRRESRRRRTNYQVLGVALFFLVMGILGATTVWLEMHKK